MEIENLKQNFFQFMNKTFSEELILKFIKNYIIQIQNEQERLNENDLKFLNRLKYYKDRINDFSELTEETKFITDIDSFNTIYSDFQDLLNDFKGFAIEERIHKEIRELLEKMDEINLLEERKININKNKRIAELESHAPKCRFGHDMVIRGDENNGHFWGCSLFPECFSKRYLKKTEQEFLDGETKSMSYKHSTIEEKNMCKNVVSSKNLAESIKTDVVDDLRAEDAFDYELYETLKSTRLSLAKELKLPTYCIFKNPSLIEMVNSLPSNKREMLTISGVGEKNYGNFGEAFLEIIHTHICQKESTKTKTTSKNIDKDENSTNEEKILYDKLYRWKENKIKEKRLVSYAIANEKALKVAAKIKPKSHDELKKIKGFSLSALDAFHNEILEIIHGVTKPLQKMRKENYISGTITIRKCKLCGNDEFFIASSSGKKVKINPGMKVKIIDD